MWSMPQCMLSENSEADSKFLYIAHIERSPYLASNMCCFGSYVVLWSIECIIPQVGIKRTSREGGW